MTDHDLATCREWCKANRVTVQETPLSEGIAYRLKGLVNVFHPSLATRFYAAYTEHEMYEKAWRILGPIIQSVRNMDAVEVPGPYQCDGPRENGCSTSYMLFGPDGMIFDRLTKRAGQTIAAILNRERRDGK